MMVHVIGLIFSIKEEEGLTLLPQHFNASCNSYLPICFNGKLVIFSGINPFTLTMNLLKKLISNQKMLLEFPMPDASAISVFIFLYNLKVSI